VPLAAVMLVSQGAGLVGIVAVVAASGVPAPSFWEMAPALGAGLAGALALAAFYQALAIGTMSIVAPVSATGVAVPVAYGVAGGEAPAALQIAGIVAAIAGVVLASREPVPAAGPAPPDGPARSRRPVTLALLAAVGFGSFFVGMDASAEHDVFWALLAARTASVGVLLAAVAVLRPSLRTGRRSLRILIAVGGLDLLANACFAVASTEGLLSVVSVLGSLYPVTTVVLARLILRERVTRGQETGVVLALAGVALIAAG